MLTEKEPFKMTAWLFTGIGKLLSPDMRKHSIIWEHAMNTGKAFLKITS